MDVFYTNSLFVLCAYKLKLKDIRFPTELTAQAACICLFAVKWITP